jgi:quinol monooxygenase YgiN
MSLVRIYQLTAAAGQRDALFSALADLAAAVAEVPGSNGSETLEANDSPGTFAFIERWASDEDHANSGAILPKSLFGAIMQSIEGKPTLTAYRSPPAN